MEKQKGFLWIPDQAGEELVEWYRASDVDQMRTNFDAAAEGHAQVVADKDARIAELERELADAKALSISLDKSNERLRQKLDRRQ